ncbi:uncharacterized protein LOC127737276 isoform X4 [Mytilus californianus]|uniref:uncharacterized protein LOC127737276 isoform X4 n=1 Tax=Mytilus californianus TaxID=6549 RepID=UPI002247776A|nr:uncharacterized protein LOC127737276 isoform X4 [Mytilus californianus]
MDANKTFCKSVNELSEYAYDFNNETERHCSKCAKQQKFNIIIFCILLVVISVNAVLAVNQITDAHRLQTLQNTIEILNSQVKDIRRRQDEGDVDVRDNQMDILDTFAFQTNPLVAEQSREKRDTNPKPCNNDPNCKKRTKRQHGRRKKKKGFRAPVKEYNEEDSFVHIEGYGGQHSPEGVFHRWQLAKWTNLRRIKGTKSLRTEKGGFVLNLETGELTIQKKGLYFLYSQITLMGNGNQSYSIEKNKNEKIASCYFFRDSNADDHNYLKRYSSCPTMGLFAFNKKDTIRLRHDHREGVMAYFEPNASFFGLIKLN